LYFILYRPIFTGDFLPKLETVIAAYEGRERAWLEKCKQDQLTNRALVLFFYALDKTSKANYLTPNDKCADLLHKIFGSSPDGIKKALDLIFKKDKRAKLEHRHLVEVGKSFEEAYAVLEAMQFEEGIQQLKHLEHQFKRP
jgi:alkyl hydroperoxide reductase subunit AhpC